MDTGQGARGVLSPWPRPAAGGPGLNAADRLESTISAVTVPPRVAAKEWIENRAPSGWLPGLDLRELWSFRELALVLALRDLKVRYKQTLLGVAWVVVQPLAAAAIFTIVFGRLAGLPATGCRMRFSSTPGWCSGGTSRGRSRSVAQSLVQNRDLVTKTYFPALVAPLALALPGLVDLLVSLAVLAVVMARLRGRAGRRASSCYRSGSSRASSSSLAAGLWLSALNVQYRDVRHTMTLPAPGLALREPRRLCQLARRGRLALRLRAQPDGRRFSTASAGRSSTAPAPGPEALVSLAVVVVMLGGGLVYFLRAERRFADVI